MNRNELMEYIRDNFSISAEAERLIDNLLHYGETHIPGGNQYDYLCSVLDGAIGLSDREIRMISL